MKKMNYLGFLSLLSLIALLGLKTNNTGLYGFFGFAYYFRYFFVIPDELFLLNVRKSSTTAFLLELVSLVPFMFFTHIAPMVNNPIPTAFALSFTLSVFVFTIYLVLLEYRESRGQ